MKYTPVGGQHLSARAVTGDESVPASSATKRARPMPTGAMNVALVFSAASINTVKTSSAVKNISMKSP